MPAELDCPRCGEALPLGEPDCPYCSGRKKIPIYRRDPVVITAVIAIAVALWVVATLVTRAYAGHQQQLADEWFHRGQSSLAAGHLDQAVRDLHTALSYSHDNFDYRLQLADALSAGGHTREARAYLQALWDEDPGNGVVNLQLARLAVRTGDTATAIRFFRGAAFGVWQDDPVENRRAARIELVSFLLAHNLAQQAQSELIGIAAGLAPRDTAGMLQVADLMMQAGDLRRALFEYQTVVALDPKNTAALSGAGKAAFNLQMYSEAREYLQRARSSRATDPQVSAELDQAERILQMDPYERGLSAAERERRIVAAFHAAGARLNQCAASRNVDLNTPSATGPLPADYSDLKRTQRSVTAANLRRNPEQGDAAMDLVFRIEHDTNLVCGPGDSTDQALVLVAQRRGRSIP